MGILTDGAIFRGARFAQPSDSGGVDSVEAALVLVLLPVAIGVASELILRDALRASLVATLLAPIVVYASVASLDPGGTWNWLASLLVAPLSMALALAAVMVCLGRAPARKRPGRRSA
ncbi:MAG TPA: hypothetical protein VMN79_12130 [Casimicrobiaceae bacterium]|nr:hypothetical protein [Casimicrobiaceae bacterium]